jgi:hypothetical protein
MAIKAQHYRAYMIKAACFEVAGTGCYIPSLVISRMGNLDTTLVNLSVTNRLFGDEEEAMNAAMDAGRSFVDSLSDDDCAMH